MDREWFFPKKEINKTLEDWEETLNFSTVQIKELEKVGSQDQTLLEHLRKRREEATAEIARLKGEGK